MRNLVDEQLGDIDTGYCHWKEYRDETILGIIKLYEQNKWVSVEDRLPAIDGFYLTDDGLCYFHFDNSLEEDEYWVYAYNPEDGSDVTVWQTLPEFKD